MESILSLSQCSLLWLGPKKRRTTCLGGVRPSAKSLTLFCGPSGKSTVPQIKVQRSDETATNLWLAAQSAFKHQNQQRWSQELLAPKGPHAQGPKNGAAVFGAFPPESWSKPQGATGSHSYSGKKRLWNPDQTFANVGEKELDHERSMYLNVSPLCDGPYGLKLGARRAGWTKWTITR